jgi:hypothetical protein
VRRVWSLAALLLLVVASVPGWGAAVAQPALPDPDVQVVYEPPVPGRVEQGFDGPAGPYAPGHRGVDLAAPAGSAVTAAADGVVTFAGTVAGARWVTIGHADGIRTSYGTFAGPPAVAPGDRVRRGQRLGAASGHHPGADGDDAGLHWSARRGATYLDPMTLLGRSVPRPSLVGPGGWAGSDPVVDAYLPHDPSARLGVMAHGSPDAERPGYALAPNHHHLVMVPGFGTAGPHPLFTPGFLGYGEQDASTFSYRGCEPTASGCEAHPYGGHDTHVEVLAAAELLRDHLRALQTAQPHRPVDLVGHSMGGDVATTYLERLHDPSDPTLPPIGRLVTIASPHGGSGVATLGRALGRNPATAAPVDLALRTLEGIGVEEAGRLGVEAPALDRYGSLFGADRPERDPARLAELDVEALYLAGSRDGVVGVDRAAPDGAEVGILPGSHGGVYGTEAALQAVHDFLAGRTVRATPGGGAVGWGSRELDTLASFGGALVELGGLPLRVLRSGG